VEAWFGEHFATLHPQLQALHREGGTLAGSVSIEFGSGAAGWIGRRLARRLGIPVEPGEHCLAVCIHSSDGALHWDRRFDTHTEFRSTFTPVGRFPAGYWIERSGGLHLRLGVEVIGGGWHWQPRGIRLGGLWLPMSLLPRARAYKEVVRGRYHFDVAISVLLAGQVLRYHGQLELRSNPAG
jgi:Domain of unknown function (DUF4166)